MIYPIIKESDLEPGDMVYAELKPEFAVRTITPWISVISSRRATHHIRVMSQCLPNVEHNAYGMVNDEWRSQTLSVGYNRFRLIKRGCPYPTN